MSNRCLLDIKRSTSSTNFGIVMKFFSIIKICLLSTFWNIIEVDIKNSGALPNFYFLEEKKKH